MYVQKHANKEKEQTIPHNEIFQYISFNTSKKQKPQIVH